MGSSAAVPQFTLPVPVLRHSMQQPSMAMTPAAWAFLSSYTLGGGEKPFAGGLPMVFPNYCKAGF